MSAGNWAMDGTWNWELPRQMLASVGWYGFWTYYRYTGDKQTIVDVYPNVRDYLSLWKIGEDGLVIHREGDWDWTDWGHHKDAAVIENAWVYLAMKGAIEMAKLSGNEGDIGLYKAKLESIEANFNNAFWKGGRYRSSGYYGETDDRAQAMAVVAGLAKPEYYPDIKKVLKSQYYASPYMEKYVLESLCLMGAPQQAIERMKKRWSEQIKSDLTTLWEGWGVGEKGYGGGTYNHAWSGGALTILSQYIAGVAPTKPGFKEFAIMPQMGNLRNTEAVVPTEYGEIRVKIRKDDKFNMNINVPAGTKTMVGIPLDEKFTGKISVNGKIVYQNGEPLRQLKAVKFAGRDSDWVRLLISKGHWKIKVN